MSEIIKSRVTRVSTGVDITVHVDDAPPMKASYLDKHHVPFDVTITYRLHVLADRWVATNVAVYGHQVLKPGPDGGQRLSEKNRLKTAWHGSLGDPVDENHRQPLPGWLATIVTAVRPSGELRLAGEVTG